jgi:L-fucose mutarotase/ribose pyranase (RbsD/FucU family)
VLKSIHPILAAPRFTVLAEMSHGDELANFPVAANMRCLNHRSAARFAIVATGDTRWWGNILLCNGVIGS